MTYRINFTVAPRVDTHSSMWALCLAPSREWTGTPPSTFHGLRVAWKAWALPCLVGHGSLDASECQISSWHQNIATHWVSELRGSHMAHCLLHTLLRSPASWSLDTLWWFCMHIGNIHFLHLYVVVFFPCPLKCEHTTQEAVMIAYLHTVAPSVGFTWMSTRSLD